MGSGSNLSSTHPDKPSKSVSLHGRRILIVEDEGLIALELEMYVSDAGAVPVGPCARVGEALDILDRQDVDCAILDIWLGREEVYPVARRLQQLGVGFVFHSGHGVGEEVAKLFPGCELLSKPSEPERLMEALLHL